MKPKVILTEMISFHCSHSPCNHHITVEDTFEGKMTICPACNGNISVPKKKKVKKGFFDVPGVTGAADKKSYWIKMAIFIGILILFRILRTYLW
jgi:hypothetical protein